MQCPVSSLWLHSAVLVLCYAGQGGVAVDWYGPLYERTSENLAEGEDAMPVTSPRDLGSVLGPCGVHPVCVWGAGVVDCLWCIH